VAPGVCAKLVRSITAAVIGQKGMLSRHDREARQTGGWQPEEFGSLKRIPQLMAE